MRWSTLGSLLGFLCASAVGLAGAALPIYAQSSYDLLGHARSTALARATTALPTDVGGHANPAVRAADASRSVTFFVRQSFGLAELRYGAVHYAEPTRFGTVSGGAGTFGFEAYREVHANLGFARSVQLGTSRQLHVGLNGRYYSTSIEGFGSASAAGLNLGLLVEVLPDLHFGAHATNVNGPTMGREEALPQTLAVGLSYRAEQRLRVVVDAFKDLDFPLSLRGGVEVQPVDALRLRTGVASQPARFTAGAGVVVGRLRADVAAEQHQTLGWSPAASLGIRW